MAATAEVTIHIASINTRHSTELTVLSARRLTREPFVLKVGDCNSTDGSLPMLRKLAKAGKIELEVAPGPRHHAAWLNQWLGECKTEWAVFLDSDLQLCRQGWLEDLLDTAKRTSAAVVGGEATVDIADFISSKGEQCNLVGTRVAPWIMLCHVPSLRAVGESFEPRMEPSENALPLLYDVASWQQQKLVEQGYRTELMPTDYQSAYRHFRGMSWRRDPGWKGFIRHRLRYSLLYLRLVRERAFSYLPSAAT